MFDKLLYIQFQFTLAACVKHFYDFMVLWFHDKIQKLGVTYIHTTHVWQIFHNLHVGIHWISLDIYFRYSFTFCKMYTYTNPSAQHIDVMNVFNTNTSNFVFKKNSNIVLCWKYSFVLKIWSNSFNVLDW